MQQVVNLRKSNLILGTNNPPPLSTMKSAYTKKDGSEGAGQMLSNNELRRTHFDLGIDSNTYQSTNAAHFIEHPVQNSQANKELAGDLRATHFSLGSENNNWTSLAQASFKKHHVNPADLKALNPDLQKNHFSLGEGNVGKNHYVTMYAKTNVPHPTGAAPVRGGGKDRASNFQLGAQGNSYQSEAGSQFKPYAGAKPSDLDVSLKNDLRSSHFKFDDVKNNQFKTRTHLDYGDKSGLSKLANGPGTDVSGDLRKSHFHMGSERPSYQSATRAAYKGDDGKPGQLDPALAKDLRSHHFNHGPANVDYKSIYKKDYKNFEDPNQTYSQLKRSKLEAIGFFSVFRLRDFSFSAPCFFFLISTYGWFDSFALIVSIGQ
eukprot:TRINITY_DN5325_c0_g4_i2.p1 TRINITY_DN5325_c0_g4~~TRINITY_DN5325_c0_g4_i2.p1  ORF type:complete len:375 (+),score=55.35 TRINITY_DN5325_c0_g4_i2:600-1724(+)